MTKNKLSRIYAERLLNVAYSLLDSPNPRIFSMKKYDAVTPSKPVSPLGHYTFREDLQKTFKFCFSRSQNAYYVEAKIKGNIFDIPKYFGLQSHEYADLFCYDGCGEAKTAREAALYIIGFIKGKQSHDTD